MNSRIADQTVEGEQQPRICSFPNYISSAGREAIELAAMSGLALDPWQEFVLTHSLGEKPDGRWAAPTVGLVVGRQNGKNTVLEARELIGLFLLDEQVIIHSAHEQATSSEHFRRILARIEGVPEFERRILKVSRGKGAEAIELRNGQRILFKTRTGGGGRGFSVDLLVFDEAMILSAEAKAALVPTMAARSVYGNTQTWYSGSAVDRLNPKHDGDELARIRQEGIRRNPRIAYFEWSADWSEPSSVPPEFASDPAVWAQANPGLGIRISPDWIEHERAIELGPREFAVERLGIGDWPDPSADGAVISLEKWLSRKRTDSAPADPVVFAFDAPPDRSSATVSVAGKRADGLWHVETAAREAGTGWLVEEIVRLTENWSPAGVFCAGSSPAETFVPALAAAGVNVTVFSVKEHAQACGFLVDAVEQDTLRHRGEQELSIAVKGAEKRLLQDAWLWSRRSSSVDISPLVAATLALWGSSTLLKRAAPRLVDLAAV